MTLSLSAELIGYDRVLPLKTGEVTPEGVSLEWANDHDRPGRIFKAQAEEQKYDLSEMSLSTFTLWTSKGTCPFVGIPAFPSRFFRHSSFFVNEDAGIEEPADLAGKAVGIPEYQITAITTARGLLQDEYGVDPEDVTWYSARPEKMDVALTPGTDLRRIGPDRELEAMLETGEIDALITGYSPDLSGNIRRLFPDFKRVERDYYERTGIFPIMHTVVLRRSIYEENPWVARAVFDALQEAKRLAIEKLALEDALQVALPWLIDHVRETREAMGENYWSYGVRRNRESLDALTRWSFDHGLSERKVEPEELFVDELLDT